MEIFCYLIGILYVYTLNNYLLLIVIALFYLTPRYILIGFFIGGMVLAYIHQWLISPHGIPDLRVIPQAVLNGTIVSIPIKNGNKVQFNFSLDKINDHSASGLVQLAWYNNSPDLHAGQHWQLTTKLKKPRNFLNPGGYDYVTTLGTHHITWTGYISSTNNKLVRSSPGFFSWLSLRERLADLLMRLAPNSQTAGIVEALTLNITTHISQDDWNLFRRTGTTHLFGISGEHVALLSGLVFCIIRWFWSKSEKCCLLFPAISVASMGGFCIALLYGFLAGFAPPVQRALIGCLFYTIRCLGKQYVTTWQVWRYALFGVLCLEPHAVFMQGFYFSFLAVACLLLTQQRWRLNGYKGNLALQLSCLAGLMPLTLYWFSYGSINGFFANLFAIPLVGFIIVPLALMTMLVSSFSWSWLLMKPLNGFIMILFKGLEWTEHLAAINIVWGLNCIDCVVALMGALLIWVLLPIKPFKYLALLWLVIPFFPSRPVINPGEALINILDVGQGLAVSIHTTNHILLYDTGDQFFQGNDLGKMVILPYFHYLGIKKVDKIIISHPDKDHKGGLKSVEAGITVDQLLVNNPKYYHHGLNCHHYGEWDWDGVHFRFFPILKSFNDKNNNSCILQISTANERILFTGDIEKIAEDYLVKKYGQQLRSDFLIIPHHGSKTSSTYRFVLEVEPRYAIASLGSDNRFHFPHAKTLSTMKSLHIPFYRTDQCGMVTINLANKGTIQEPQCYNPQSF
ncbi:MAG: DNA internalization-related competence protein ComEC/Rec2 [bacterium]|nr:DNA internalization-related competence protein ComEC/Rec2 [bacterium]